MITYEQYKEAGGKGDEELFSLNEPESVRTASRWTFKRTDKFDDPANETPLWLVENLTYLIDSLDAFDEPVLSSFSSSGVSSVSFAATASPEAKAYSKFCLNAPVSFITTAVSELEW